MAAEIIDFTADIMWKVTAPGRRPLYTEFWTDAELMKAKLNAAGIPATITRTDWTEALDALKERS